MAPTHARIITPFVPLGIFTEEQNSCACELPLEPFDDGSGSTISYRVPGSSSHADRALSEFFCIGSA
jgi:hypothetical protein